MKRGRDDMDGVDGDLPVNFADDFEEGDGIESLPMTASTSTAAPSLGDVQASVIRLLASRAADAGGVKFAALCVLVGVVAPSDTSVSLRAALSVNPRVRIDGSNDAFHYRTRYAARDATELARLITAQGEAPIPVPDLTDLFPGAPAELDALVRTGEVVRIASDSPLPDVIFSRDLVDVTRVRLSGTFALTTGSAIVRTSADLTNELFRNDIIIFSKDSQFFPFRVSSQAIPMPFQRLGGGGAGASMSAGAGASAGGDVSGSEALPISTSSAVAEATGGSAISGPASGIYYVSIGNSVRKTGGNYSAADTAAHELRATFTYAHPYTAKSLPLDRPWTGPTTSGLTAFRMGAPGDLRALWREVVTHEAVARSAGAAAAAAAAELEAAAKASVNASAAAAAPTLSLLGGAAAFRDAPDFPGSHRALRDAMKRAAVEERARGVGGGGGGGCHGLETHMAPGTLEASAPIPTRAPRDPHERALLRRSNKHRKVSVRELQIVGAERLAPGVREAVQRAQYDALRKKIVASHAKEYER